MGITVKDEAGIQGMRTAGRLAAEVLDQLTPFIKPGITTREIDRIAAEHMKKQGSTSATLGYQPAGYPPYPASLCTSVNHVVCHGIPNDKPLKKADIVNVDVTVIKDGWYGDTSRMFMVGEVSIAAMFERSVRSRPYEGANLELDALQAAAKASWVAAAKFDWLKVGIHAGLHDVRAQHRYAVSARVCDQRLRGVEAHRLCPQQPGQKRSGIVQLEP